MPRRIRDTYEQLTSRRWIYDSCRRLGCSEEEYKNRIRELAEWLRSRAR